MSDAAASTITPTKLGKHLRAVRRKKGLSLSEVARGAGLSRRELVAYERGKTPIPESDLWVLAGSCGVDVGDLLPATPAPEFEAIPTSIGDTVAQLRHGRDDNDAQRYLATLTRLRELPAGSPVPVADHELAAMADALGREPEVVESRLRQMMSVSPNEAAHLRSLILPTVTAPPRVRALAASNGQPAHLVDVFHELSQLPEPPELPDPTVPIDFLAPPMGAVEMIDNEFANFDSQLGSGYTNEHHANGNGLNGNGFSAAGLASVPEPVLVDSSASYAGAWNAADAPPIDVAFRGGSTSSWDANASLANESPASAEAEASPWPTTWDNPTTESIDPSGLDSSDAGSTGPSDWQPTGWDIPVGIGAPTFPEPAHELPESLWETTDAWTPDDERRAEPTTAAPPAPWDVADTATGWPTDVTDAPAWPTDVTEAAAWPVDASSATAWPVETTDPIEAPPFGETSQASGETYPGWGHDPDPEATSTGFYVDWGTAEPEPEATASVAPEIDTAAPEVDPLSAGWPPADIGTEANDDAGFEPIAWRAEPAALIPEVVIPEVVIPDVLIPEVVTPLVPAFVAAELADPIAPPAAVAPEDFVVAGTEWQLGNALPLVEVRGTGSLVMRRADERWALADVSTTRDFVLEVDVDFRSGPGLGILFCASVDQEGRMSGYSFDIDPIYDGGGYLVRQWQHDRELWNPIARMSAVDPESMCGLLTVRLVVENDCLVASVNDAQVLAVDGLKQASADRGRDPATGDRVGVQAWSSSDLVIDSLRVAPR